MLERRLPALMDSGGVPGLAVAVVRDGRVEWARGFGVRRAGSPEAVGDSTVFEAASLGKSVFAYLVLKLTDEGLLELDRPLAEYLPLSDLRDPRASRITARMVLSHTAGLPNALFPGDSLALAFDPGSAFRYSGEGYNYLQRVVEHVTGRPLELLAQERVFGPLGMTRSAYVWRERFASDAAIGHGGGQIPRSPGLPAAARASSSLHTTASDYARFLAAVLEGKGLQENTAREMGTAYQRAAAEVPWGLGWALEETESPPALWHWGDNSNTGYTAFAIISPAREAGAVWLANSATALSVAAPLLDMTLPGMPARLETFGYQRHDAPGRLVREELDRLAVERGAAEALEEHARMRSRFPADRFDEGQLNTLGYRMLERGRVAEAVELFRANVELYPESGNVHDSMGEALAAAGEREAAIASYRRSLELDPGNTNATLQIRRLGEAPADTAAVRRELEARYEENRRAFLAEDVAAIMAIRTEDFHAVGPDGTERSRADMEQYTIGLLNGIERWISMEFEIDSLEVSGDLARAVVRQHLVRMALRPDNKVHHVETWATQNETWRKTTEGWKLYRVDGVRDQRRLVDGRQE